MKFDKKAFLDKIRNIISLQLSGDKEQVINSICHLIKHYWDFNLVTEYMLADKSTTWKELKATGDFFSILFNHTAECDRASIVYYASRCYGRAFLLCPMRERHGIIYAFNDLLGITYRSFTCMGESQTTYSSFFAERLDPHYYICKVLDEAIKWTCHTRDHRSVNIIQSFLYHHLISYNTIRPNSLSLNMEEIGLWQSKFDHNLKGISQPQIKKAAVFVLKSLLYFVSDEEISWYHLENDEFWEFDSEKGEVFEVDLDEEALREYERHRSQSDYDESFDEDDGECGEYNKYRGSYAQDEMGYSDDDIDTILDGDPDAYWNID